MILTKIPTLKTLFYDENIMPCCGKQAIYYRGPRGGNCFNIKCAHCSQRWNIEPHSHYIEKL